MRPASTRRSQFDGRRAVTAVLALLDAAVLALVVVGVHGHARELAGLVFCVFVPGWSIVGLVRIRDAVLELCLTMATALASLVVLAQVVITLSDWRLFGIEVVVCAVCLASLLYQLVAVQRVPRGAR
jgi:uncharacterized membrane protein